MMTL
jgi:hypothetical protein